MRKTKSKYTAIKKIHLNILKDDLKKKFSEEFELTNIPKDSEVLNCSRFGFIKGDEFSYNAFCYGGERVIQIKGKIIEDSGQTIVEYTYKKRKARKIPAFIIYNLIFLGVIYYFNIYLIGISLLALFNLFLIFILKKDSKKKIREFKKKIKGFVQ